MRALPSSLIVVIYVIQYGIKLPSPSCNIILGRAWNFNYDDDIISEP